MMDGFELIPEAISLKWEDRLIVNIKAALAGVNRDRYGIGERSRVKRYGYDYTPKVKKVEDVPEWLGQFYGILKLVTVFQFNINSVTINEYKPGHGIASHVDADYFGPVIAILSLGGSAAMTVGTTVWCKTEIIWPRSLTILSGNARNWIHSIDGKSVKETRYSIVFRERLLK